MKLQIKKLTLIKYTACLFFIIPGIINLIDTVVNSRQYYWRDIIILIVLSLPLLINRRLFFVGYGLLASVVAMLIFFAFLFNNMPAQADTSVLTYITGCIVYFSGIISGMAMIYIGTYSKDKNTFRLV